MKKLKDLQLGDTVWAQKINRKDVEAFTITGETHASWVIDVSSWEKRTFPKTLKDWETLYTLIDNRGYSVRIFISEEEIADDNWKKDNAYRISTRVHAIRDIKLLREIARMVGYVEVK